MSTTVNNVQQDVSAAVDQTTTVPTESGSEYALRLNFINRSLREYAGAYDWEATRKTLWLTVTGVSQASISLPADYRKMSSFPLFHSGGVSGGEGWAQIKPEDLKQYHSTDKYFYELGNSGDGNTMIWNPGTLASGASLLINYYSYPTSLASPADILPIDDDGREFVVHRTASFIFETRNDAKFQPMEAKARENLLQMIDNENAPGLPLQKNTRVETPENKYHGFRIGRD